MAFQVLTPEAFVTIQASLPENIGNIPSNLLNWHRLSLRIAPWLFKDSTEKHSSVVAFITLQKAIGKSLN
jgi:hypothetical protein